MNNGKIFVVFAVLMFALSLASAQVGLGVSPSKIREQFTAGESYDYELLIFNTGSSDMSVELVAKGEIAEFVEVVPMEEVIQPEPMPREMPIKNGKLFKVVFNPPKASKLRTYTGHITAVGGTTDSNSQFGGNVAVVSQVELEVVPPKSIFAKISKTHYMFVGIILVLGLLIVGARKSGLKISFGEQAAKPVRRKRTTKKKK